MTSKIATVANLALRVFQQHSVRSTVTSTPLSSLTRGQLSEMGVSVSRTNSQHYNNSSVHLSELCLPSELLQRLLTFVRTLTPTDIGFDNRWISDASIYAAPVIYVHITQNEVFSMGIFILRPGSRIPLHDHPGMYGILRVIYGAIRCRSFTRMHHANMKAANQPLATLSSASRWQLSGLVIARPHQDTVVTSENDVQMLDPLEGNLHEISPVDGPAVFLDILAPPYDHDLGTRECRFYKEVILPQPVWTHNLSMEESSPNNSSGSNEQLTSTDSTSQIENQAFEVYGHQAHSPTSQPSLVYLVETNQPKDYWCESAEYVGPRVAV